jgi:hypothetical protein
MSEFARDIGLLDILQIPAVRVEQPILDVALTGQRQRGCLQART